MVGQSVSSSIVAHSVINGFPVTYVLIERTNSVLMPVEYQAFDADGDCIVDECETLDECDHRAIAYLTPLGF